MICISICMLFPLCDPRHPFLGLAFMIFRSSELAVDEDGIQNDGVSFRLGKTDSTWELLGSTLAFSVPYFSYLEIRNYIFKITPKILNL